MMIKLIIACKGLRRVLAHNKAQCAGYIFLFLFLLYEHDLRHQTAWINILALPLSN